MREYHIYLIEKLRDPDYAEIYINAALQDYLENDDINSLFVALEHLARAQYSIKDLAEQADISRQHLYKIFDNEITPNMNTFITIIKSLGFTLEVKRKTQPA